MVFVSEIMLAGVVPCEDGTSLGPLLAAAGPHLGLHSTPHNLQLHLYETHYFIRFECHRLSVISVYVIRTCRCILKSISLPSAFIRVSI